MYVASYSKINAFKAHHVYIKAANIILAFHIRMYSIRRYRMYIINIISNKLYSTTNNEIVFYTNILRFTINLHILM